MAAELEVKGWRIVNFLDGQTSVLVLDTPKRCLGIENQEAGDSDTNMIDVQFCGVYGDSLHMMSSILALHLRV